MTEEIDTRSGHTWIQLSDEEVKMGFLAQCIEAVAEAESCDYLEMLNRMEKVNMTNGYILEVYDALHLESWETVVADLRKLLHKREALKD